MAGSFTFVPSEADQVSASRANYRRLASNPRMWRGLSIVIVMCGVLLALLIGYKDQDWYEAWFMLLTVPFSFVLLGTIIGLGYLLVLREARRLFRQQKCMGGDLVVEWNDTGVLWRGPGAMIERPWRAYHGWLATDREFLLYHNDALYQYLPRRAMDGAQAEDLRKTLVEHGPPRR